MNTYLQSRNYQTKHIKRLFSKFKFQRFFSLSRINSTLQIKISPSILKYVKGKLGNERALRKVRWHKLDFFLGLVQLHPSHRPSRVLYLGFSLRWCRSRLLSDLLFVDTWPLPNTVEIVQKFYISNFQFQIWSRLL